MREGIASERASEERAATVSRPIQWMGRGRASELRRVKSRSVVGTNVPRRSNPFSYLFLILSLLSQPAFGQIRPKLPWDRLASYHRTLTEQEFRDSIDEIYSPDGSLYAYLDITPSYAEIFRDKNKNGPPLFRLFFARNEKSKRPVPGSLRQRKDSSPLPLQGLRVLLDPGHIGGPYAKMEQRFLARSDGVFIQEGDLNLKVAQLLKKKLEGLGAKVYLTKDKLRPATHKKPEDFENAKLFYRVSEIQARADLAKRIRPDFTLCLHFNAAPATAQNPWTSDNRLVIFTHGCYAPEELDDEEERLKLFSKLLEGSSKTELALARSIAKAMARQTGLPPVRYDPSPYYRKVADNPYLYTRNFSANRLFPGPVIYLEPYYQNNPLVFERLVAGDYEGEKTIQGKLCKSIFREYSDSVADGIVRCFAASSEY